MFTYERRHEKLAPFPVFVRRILAALGIAVGLMMFALTVGIVGYHFIAELDWVDSLLEASMILGGMGPVDPITRDGGKWFASIYALVSGIVLLGSAGVFFAPLIHRFLHKLHLDTKDEGGD